MVKSAAVKVDAKLIGDGTISEDYEAEYKLVHDFLNKNVRTYDAYLKEDDFKSAEVELRGWVKELQQEGADADKMTSFLKCGMSHLCFDYIDVKNTGEELDEDSKVTRALLSFKKRRFNKMFVKASSK